MRKITVAILAVGLVVCSTTQLRAEVVVSTFGPAYAYNDNLAQPVANHDYDFNRVREVAFAFTPQTTSYLQRITLALSLSPTPCLCTALC